MRFILYVLMHGEITTLRQNTLATIEMWGTAYHREGAVVALFDTATSQQISPWEIYMNGRAKEYWRLADPSEVDPRIRAYHLLTYGV